MAITWVGYDQPKSLGRQFGATLALPIWIDFMRSVLPTLPERQLPMPSGIVTEDGGTWKGDTEYYYEGSIIGKHNASGELGEEESGDGLSPQDSNASDQLQLKLLKLIAANLRQSIIQTAVVILMI